MDIGDAVFDRLSLLVGRDALELIKSKRVIIFGVGGVGSWCAESLVRNGISHLTMVDSDRVGVTNVNRQLQATTKTIGRVKVEVLKERLLEINPKAEIIALQEIYSADNAEMFHLDGYDYIIDAIDSLENKACLILHATNSNGKLFSAMGAALKMDPTRIEAAEFWQVKGCPLARALRKKFKKKDEYPKKKFTCVFSSELLENKGVTPILTSEECCMEQSQVEGNAELANHDWSVSKARVNGTTSHITAMFGFMLAGLVMRDICG